MLQHVIVYSFVFGIKKEKKHDETNSNNKYAEIFGTSIILLL